MAIKSRNKVSPNFNMSSMTDIVFLLLIFFMLTSTLVSPNALKLLLPSSDNKTLAKQTVSISINAQREYFVNRTKVPFEQLEYLLLQEIVGKDDPSVILHVEKTLPIEEAVKVMDIASRNKLKMVLATQPKK
jgi:biopolymer transport protein ExbD